MRYSTTAEIEVSRWAAQILAWRQASVLTVTVMFLSRMGFLLKGEPSPLV
jgi:hypothetical protein